MTRKYELDYVSSNPLVNDPKISKAEFVRVEKEEMLKQIFKHPEHLAADILYKLTGQDDIYKANYFCLSLIVDILERPVKTIP